MSVQPATRTRHYEHVSWDDDIDTVFIKARHIAWLVARKILASPDDAEDVAQFVVVVLWRYLSRIDRGRPLAPWITTVARRRCLDVLRERRRVTFVSCDPWNELLPGDVYIDLIDPDPDPCTRAVNGDARAYIWCQVANLPKRYQAAARLWLTGEHTMPEIAALLGQNENTVKTHIWRARQILRRVLKAYRAN